MKDRKLAKKIVELTGGVGNLNSVTNCMTRVRINLKDDSIVQIEEIEKLEGVLGTNKAETMQIIVGPGKSTKVREEIEEIMGSSSVDSNSSFNDGDEDSKKKNGLLKTFASIFVPIIPAIIASGLIMGVNSIITNMAEQTVNSSGISGTDSLSAQQVVLDSWNLLGLSTFFDILSDATFPFLAIFVGITSARVFNVDTILGGALGAITLAPQLDILGLSTDQGGLLGVILGVYLLSKVNKIVKKFVPNILDVVLTPTLTLLITAAIFMATIMPLAGFLSDWLVNGILWLLDYSGLLGGFVLAASFPFLIVTGLHHGLIPIHMELINATGTTPIFAIGLMSNPGMVGAAIAIYLLSKSKQVKDVAKAAIPTTFLAVGEPTMYGVLLPSGFGFITGALGAGIGGMMISFFGIETSAIGAAGMSSIPLIANGDYLPYLFCYAIACVAAFIITYLAGKARRYS
ncbi:PTS transporter subunit EIIC [Virgibacillus sp. NKC19-3]|uniref:PTS transporter subunit EIIC n=1 Tax=Virgibacillus saliphilus TaxID=2831674 RepID=UPI001C9B89E7|nr:PTS transporter subunit EIIC [Virgibacillus sp. NKC19-3]MBY7142781.1 PTS transporter subunit EIIC [Virgibacillus sp. NKC19-3]